MKRVCFAVALCVGGFTSHAQAQWWIGARPYGWGGAVDARAARLAGAGELIRARGEAAVSASRARINNQDATSKYIDNKQKWVQYNIDKKKMGRAARDEYYARKRASRDAYLKKQENKQWPRLSPSQLDPATGQMTWPETLQGKQYAASRKELDEILRLRSYTRMTPDMANRLRKATSELKNELKKQIRSIPSYEYISARRFIDRLENEARYAA